VAPCVESAVPRHRTNYSRGVKGVVRLVGVFLTVVIGAAGCGSDADDGPREAQGGDRRVRGYLFEPGNEPRIEPGTDLCPDLRSGGEFIAFRILAKGVDCREAAEVVKGAVDDAPPAGWRCQRIRGDFTGCAKGGAKVGFNR
jgi:hypothetical protein